MEAAEDKEVKVPTGIGDPATPTSLPVQPVTSIGALERGRGTVQTGMAVPGETMKVQNQDTTETSPLRK